MTDTKDEIYTGVYPKCIKDNGLCGVGGFCDVCPHVMNNQDKISPDICIGWLADEVLAALPQYRAAVDATIAHLLRLQQMEAELEACRRDAERIDTIMDAFHRVRVWIDAYPLSVFPEPDFKRAREVLKANGMTIDAISASNMRHVLTGIRSIIDSAISAGEDSTNDWHREAH